MNATSIPILLVEDQASDVAIIQRFLKKNKVFNPIHLARDGQEAITFLRQSSGPLGILILDIHLPKINGMEVLKVAKTIDPQAVVIMLTSQASLKTAVQSLRHEGAFDYLQKSKEELPELVETVRLALEKRALSLRNQWVLQSGGSEYLVDMNKVEERFGLSHREMDVVKCICQGDRNKRIAEKLFISELTIKVHLKNIFEKLGVHNRTTLSSKILASAMIR